MIGFTLKEKKKKKKKNKKKKEKSVGDVYIVIYALF